MEEISTKNTQELLDKTFRLEGGNIESCNLDLVNDQILIYAYPEGAPLQCCFKLTGIISFNICDPSGLEFYGLSGYPHSLEVVWDSEGKSVLLAIGANEAEQDIESLKSCNFYVHAKKLYANVE